MARSKDKSIKTYALMELIKGVFFYLAGQFKINVELIIDLE
ncbi:hypothetical protein [Desulfotruncus arcticus]|nr:hypothetical protein [Desulfotruncus arcticus]